MRTREIHLRYETREPTPWGERRQILLLNWMEEHFCPDQANPRPGQAHPHRPETGAAQAPSVPAQSGTSQGHPRARQASSGLPCPDGTVPVAEDPLNHP